MAPLAAAFGIASAVSSIAGGIFGSSQASKANQEAKAAQEAQQKLLNQQAKLQNKYNQEKFEADKKNYEKLAGYNFETAIKKWQYDTSIKALQEKVDAQKFLMSMENSQKQLTFNDIAEQQAQSQTQTALNEAKSEAAFTRQDLLVSQLEAQGKAMLGQAGKGMAKAMQSEQAQIGRNLAVLDASLSGEINNSTLAMFYISLGKYAADAKVEAAKMLMPETLPDIPAPTKPPEPIWVKPMKVLPGMAAPAAQQSIAMPLIQGFGNAASSLASINWSSPNKSEKFTPPTPTPPG